MGKLKVSERFACRVMGQLRTTQRYEKVVDLEREKVRARILELAREYGRYGYKTITSMLQLEGFDVGKDRVHRIWQEEGRSSTWPAFSTKTATIGLQKKSWIRWT